MPGAFHPIREPGSVAAADPFLAAVRCDSGRIDVLQAALAIVLDARPDADVAWVREQLDAWGAQLSRRIRAAGAEEEPLTGALLLVRMLFEDEGFRGDTATPQDPANSELDLVLVRRCGLPITLGLLMVEVGKRAGLPLAALSFPGRLLVGLATPPRPVLFDPFRGGRVVLPEECQGLLATPGSDSVRASLHGEFLEPLPPARFVERMLAGLRQAHVKHGQLGDAVRVQGRIVDLRPSDPGPLQDRAWLCFQLGRHASALADLEAAERLAGSDDTAGEIRRQLDQVRRWAAAVGR